MKAVLKDGVQDIGKFVHVPAAIFGVIVRLTISLKLGIKEKMQFFLKKVFFFRLK